MSYNRGYSLGGGGGGGGGYQSNPGNMPYQQQQQQLPPPMHPQQHQPPPYASSYHRPVPAGPPNVWNNPPYHQPSPMPALNPWAGNNNQPPPMMSPHQPPPPHYRSGGYDNRNLKPQPMPQIRLVSSLFLGNWSIFFWQFVSSFFRLLPTKDLEIGTTKAWTNVRVQWTNNNRAATFNRITHRS